MTNTFDLAQAFTEPAEGGLVDHPNDPGGLTNLGVSLRFLKDEGIDIDGDGVISRADIYAMTPGKTKAVFRRAFWDKLQLDLLRPGTAIALRQRRQHRQDASGEVPSTRGRGERRRHPRQRYSRCRCSGWATWNSHRRCSDNGKPFTGCWPRILPTPMAGTIAPSSRVGLVVAGNCGPMCNLWGYKHGVSCVHSHPWPGN
jgi:hypothetical protein